MLSEKGGMWHSFFYISLVAEQDSLIRFLFCFDNLVSFHYFFFFPNRRGMWLSFDGRAASMGKPFKLLVHGSLGGRV